MSGSVAPLKVSPLIKTSRWALLIFGIFYGANRLQRIRAIESVEVPKRKAALVKKYQMLKEEEFKMLKAEIIQLSKDFEADLPEGWEESVK